MGSEVVIRTEALSKRYGNRFAVERLDLEVKRGVVCGFLGLNGAGKTTTLRMLLGLVKPTSGAAEVLGVPVAQWRRLAGRVGAIIETPAFYPFLSGRQNLQAFASSSVRRVDKARIVALLRQVGLEGREDEKVSGYSLGMRQRLGLAAALLPDPELLFLDEPTNGLDPAGVMEMRALVASLAREGRTLFVSSHQLSEIQQICSEVCIIHRGVSRLHGPVKEVLAAGARVRLRASPVARAMALLSAAGHPGTVEEDGISVAVDPSRTAELVRALVLDGVDVHAVEQVLPTLEQRFLELTREAA